MKWLVNTCIDLSQVTLTALGELFQAARAIMGWLGDCAKVCPRLQTDLYNVEILTVKFFNNRKIVKRVGADYHKPFIINLKLSCFCTVTSGVKSLATFIHL